VNGASFYEVIPGPLASVINIHPVAASPAQRPVTFASNGAGGNQLAVCSAGVLYIFDLVTAAWTVVPLPFVPRMVGYMDGYFLANEVNTPKMWFSNLENGLVWSATDFFTRSSTSDNITGFAVNNRRIWVIGTKTTELFIDSGDATTPFLPMPGSVINEGTTSYASIISIADTVFWVGATKDFGLSQIFAATGLQVRAISTAGVSANISQAVYPDEAEALAYTERGHVFICWTWPSYKVTWSYDVTEEAWHNRGNFIETAPGSGTFGLETWQARGVCGLTQNTGQRPLVLVGQRDTPFLCGLDAATLTDQTASAGVTNTILRQRIAPYLGVENQWIFLQQLELGLESIADGLPVPVPELLISGDNLRTQGPPIPAAVGGQMDGQAVAQWFQLGRYRADRLVLSVRQHAIRPCVWGPGLWIRVTPGTGQL
jgi:hypothetical protein